MPRPSCVTEETRDLFQHLAQRLMEKGVIGTVQPVRTGCLNRCQYGPVMLVEPGHYMYAHLTKEKIDRIIDEHIMEGKPVEEFLIEAEAWDDPIPPKQMQQMAGGAY
jgi:(2Fe-2S) ferredoxin